MAYPANYKYTREHEWIEVAGNVGTIGITDHAQSSLGDIVFVEAPEVGAKVEKGATFGSVESVKAVSDLFSPVSGAVKEVNAALKDSPEKLNTDPYSAWIIRVDLSNPSELDSLLSAADYEAFVKEETGK